MENSNYEAVRAKIKETCPDAVEVVEWKGNEPYIVKDSPLRISHVLRAIAGKVDSTACMYPDGSFVEWDSSGDNYYTLFCYDLTKDDLSLQSLDTIDFLFKILCE